MSSYELTEWIALATVEAEERGDMGPPPPDDEDEINGEPEPELPLTAEEIAEVDELDRLLAELNAKVQPTING